MISEPTYDWPKWLKKFYKVMIWCFFCCIGIGIGMILIMFMNYISFGHWDWGLENEIEILKELFK